MRETATAYLLPLELRLVVRMYVAVAVCARGQHVVLDLQQPQLADSGKELVGGAGDLFGGRQMDVAVIAVEV